METKEYSNGEVTIVWKPELCTHSANCARGLASVFKPKEKPWIDAHGATTEQIIEQVRRCPSGALSTYLKKDTATMTDPNFSLNEDKHRFELEVDGHIAFIEFILNKENIIFLTHTEVPEALGGKGVGSKIVEMTLQYVKEKGYPLAPLCPFVAKYMRKHTEWQTLLATGYNV